MKKVLIDTLYLIAIINRRNQWHKIAIEVSEKLDNTLFFLTETVLVETLNYFSAYKPEVKQHTVETIEGFLSNPLVEVIEQTSEVFQEGMKLYASRLDKGYSLTDCISMNVCRELEITEILTHDHHFEQEGFTILL